MKALKSRYMLWVLLSSFLLGEVQGIYAQNPDNPEIQAFMVAFYTRKLMLSPDEAKVFWPVHDAFSAEHRAAQKASRAQLAKITRGTMVLSDKELEQLGDEFLVLKQKEFDVVKKYHDEFKQILPIRKVLMLYKVEQEYKKALLEEIRRRRQERMKKFRNNRSNSNR